MRPTGATAAPRSRKRSVDFTTTARRLTCSCSVFLKDSGWCARGWPPANCGGGARRASCSRRSSTGPPRRSRSSSVFMLGLVGADLFGHQPAADGEGSSSALLIFLTALAQLWINHPNGLRRNSRLLLIFGVLLLHLAVVKMMLVTADAQVMKALISGSHHGFSGVERQLLWKLAVPYALAPLTLSVLLGRNHGIYAAIFVEPLERARLPQPQRCRASRHEPHLRLHRGLRHAGGAAPQPAGARGCFCGAGHVDARADLRDDRADRLGDPSAHALDDDRLAKPRRHRQRDRHGAARGRGAAAVRKSFSASRPTSPGWSWPT